MSIQLPIDKALGTFHKTFQSLDIRVASIRQSKQWVNLLTLIRCRYEKPDVIAQTHQRLRKIFGDIGSSRFRVDLIAEPISRWHRTIQRIEKGALTVNRRRIGFDVAQSEHHLSNVHRSHTIPNLDDMNWPGFEFRLGKFDSQRRAADDLTLAANSVGANSIDAVLNSLFEAKVFGGGPPSYSVYIQIPTFSLITDTRIGGDTLDVTVRHHPVLKIAPKMLVQRNDQGTLVAVGSIPMEPTNVSDEADGLVTTHYVGQRPTDVKQWIYATLDYPGVGTIQDETRQVEALLPVQETNPLSVALKRFCPDETLRNALLRGHEKSGQKLKSSAAFELHVSWLLSMLGFSPIVLGEYEKLSAANREFAHGSVDILAANPVTKTLFLVGCTMVVPPASDHSSLLSVKSELEAEVFQDRINIQPVIFTPKHGVAVPDSIGQQVDVLVIDANRMEDILRRINYGQASQVREHFESPSWPLPGW